jgi:hypothetical protein
MKWRLEIIGTITPSTVFAACFLVSFVDDSIRLPVIPSIVLCLASIAMIVIGVIQRNDWRPLRKFGELIALCIVMVLLFVPVLLIFGILGLMMFGLDGIQ